MTAFEEAKLRALLHLQDRSGIGTLGERSLHAVLKYWIEPDERRHEVKLPCGLVADIYDGERVVEIQTGSLYQLRGKLDRLLPFTPVTIVVPVVRKKTLVWLDPETGEATPPRRSPRVGGFWDRLPDLYWLLPYFSDPGLVVRLVELDLVESRARDGWGRDGKRGSHRVERVPSRWEGSCGCKALPTVSICCLTACPFPSRRRISRKLGGCPRKRQDLQ